MSVERRDSDIPDQPNSPCQEFFTEVRRFYLFMHSYADYSQVRWSTLDKAVEWGWDNDVAHEVSPASQSGNSTVRADSFSPADAVDASVPVLCQAQSGNSTASSANTNISPGVTTYGPTVRPNLRRTIIIF